MGIALVLVNLAGTNGDTFRLVNYILDEKGS